MQEAGRLLGTYSGWVPVYGVWGLGQRAGMVSTSQTPRVHLTDPTCPCHRHDALAQDPNSHSSDLMVCSYLFFLIKNLFLTTTLLFPFVKVRELFNCDKIYDLNHF